MAANLDLFRMHLHRKPNANTKLDLWSPIVDRNKIFESRIDYKGNLLSVMRLESESEKKKKPSSKV